MTTKEHCEKDAVAVLPNETKELKNLLYSNELQGREIMELFTLENPRYKEKLELFIDNGKYRNCTILRILKSQKVLDVIDRMGIEKFSFLLDRDGFEFEADSSDDRWIHMVDNILQNQTFIYAITQIDIEKLHVIFGSSNVNDNRIYCLLSDANCLTSVIDLDIDKFIVLYQANWLDFLRVMNGLEPATVSIINSLICTEKLKILVVYYYAINRLLRNPFVVDFIRVIDLEKLGPLFNFHSSNFDALLYFPEWANAEFINNINSEKLTFLYGSGVFSTSYEFYLFLRDRERINLLNSIDIKKLKIIFMVISKFDLLSIFFFNIKLDVRKHLSFAMALYKRDVISNIKFEYVSNEDVLFEDVIKVFPKSIPIRRILEQPTKIELVPRLQDRCIETYIEHKSNPNQN